MITTGGSVPDIAVADDLIAAIPPVAGRIGRPRRSLTRSWLRRGTTRPPSGPLSRDAAFWRAVMSQRKRRDLIGLGSLRWVVERTIAHLHQF